MSFVNPARVPQMAGAEEVVAALERRPGVVYAGLVLNERGYDRLAATGLDEAHFAFSATETFNQRNQGAPVAESVEAAGRIVARAHEDGIRVTVTIGVAFGCPFEGAVDPEHVVRLRRADRRLRPRRDRARGHGRRRHAGAGRPARRVRRRARAPGRRPPPQHAQHRPRQRLRRGRGRRAVLDASVGGIGGCPFAPRATGNIATEDLVYLLHGEGIETGIDLGALIGVAEWLEGVLGRQLEGQVYRAGTFAPVAA